jgi:hypothetical protein
MQNEERINGLETQVRTLKRIVYGFGCLLVAGVVVSATTLQTVPDVIQAKSFEVICENGNAVVVLDSHILELEAPLKRELHYGSITTLNSQGRTLVTLGANPCFGTGQLMTMNAHGRLLVKVGAEFQKLRYGVVGNGGLIETYQENGTVTSYSPSDNEQTFRDPYNLSTQTEQRCCQNPHHVECIVNTTSASPGSCQHAHHLECGVDTIS